MLCQTNWQYFVIHLFEKYKTKTASKTKQNCLFLIRSRTQYTIWHDLYVSSILNVIQINSLNECPICQPVYLTQGCFSFPHFYQTLVHICVALTSTVDGAQKCFAIGFCAIKVNEHKTDYSVDLSKCNFVSKWFLISIVWSIFITLCHRLLKNYIFGPIHRTMKCHQISQWFHFGCSLTQSIK